jgi:HEAT repeat protein
MPEVYSELEVRVRAVSGSENSYAVEARLNDSPVGYGELGLDEFELRLADFDIDPKAYGEHLFHALFNGRMRDVYFWAVGRAEERTNGRLRVRLLIEAPRLHVLYWERLYYIRDGRSVPLAASASTPFSRQLFGDGDISTRVPKAPLRMLIAISNPSDLGQEQQIQVQDEVQSLRQALGELPRLGQVKVTVLPGHSSLPPEFVDELEDEGYVVLRDQVTSLDNILRLLRESDVHVFHFLGHGQFRAGSGKDAGTASLLLEDEGPLPGLEDPTASPRGSRAWIEDETLVPKFATIDVDELPRLVFLAACESAKRDPEGAFTGLAPMLIEAGVPAVVAMQELVGMSAARELTGEFYRRLLEHGMADRALNEARSLLFDPDEVDWSIPALFLNSRAEERLIEPNYVRAAQKQILEWAVKKTKEIAVPMPLEVVHLQGAQYLASVQRLGRGGIAAVDMLSAVRDILAQAGKWVVLTSDRGTARTSQLYHLVRQTAESELTAPSEPPVIPLYVALGNNYPPEEVGSRNPIEVLILQSLKEWWPDLEASTLEDVLRDQPDLTLWVLLDDSDDLPLRQRTAAWGQVEELASTHREHAYLLTVGLANYVPRLLRKATDVLVIQPLAQRAIVAFLTGSDDPRDSDLRDKLRETRLFDLASTPWLLAGVLRRARRGDYPESRTKVLEDLIEDAVARMEVSHAIRPQAARILYELAYRMKRDYADTWEIADAFRTMAEVRENREYNLEELCDELVRCGILARAGDKIGFAYPAYEDYCCARAIDALASEEQDRALEDITVSMSRVSRLRVWEGTLVLLSGMMDDPNVLLEQLLYGASSGDCERIHVAARCLLEAGRTRVKKRLWDRVVDALISRLSPDNVQEPALRARAAQALGELEDPSAIPHLARAANARVRIGQERNEAYEYSNVRMAAVLALKRIEFCYQRQSESADSDDQKSSASKIFEQDVRAVDPDLADLMQHWRLKSVSTLKELLCSGDEGIGPLAAFPLAVLYLEGKGECLDILIDVFREAGGVGATRWAVADALTLLDATLVTRRAILPLIDTAAAKAEGLTDSEVWSHRALQYERLAYLIGHIRAPDPWAREFLRDRLKNDGRVYVKGRSIQALGALYDRSVKDLLERIANANWAGLSLPSDFSAGDEHYLRRKAIEALAFVGDEGTLEALEEGRSGWTPELRRAFYEASEEIVWRQGLGRVK